MMLCRICRSMFFGIQLLGGDWNHGNFLWLSHHHPNWRSQPMIFQRPRLQPPSGHGSHQLGYHHEIFPTSAIGSLQLDWNLGNFSPCTLSFFPVTTSAHCRNLLPGRKDWNCTIFFYDVSTIFWEGNFRRHRSKGLWQKYWLVHGYLRCFTIPPYVFYNI